MYKIFQIIAHLKMNRHLFIKLINFRQKWGEKKEVDKDKTQRSMASILVQIFGSRSNTPNLHEVFCQSLREKNMFRWRITKSSAKTLLFDLETWFKAIANPLPTSVYVQYEPNVIKGKELMVWRNIFHRNLLR